MTTPYRAVTFTKDDVVTKEVMDVMESNLQYIYDYSPRGKYVANNGTVRETQSVFTSGSLIVPLSKTSATLKKRISFGATFDSGCTPRLTTGIVADWTNKIYVSVTRVDHSSFDIWVEAAGAAAKDKYKIKHSFIVCWQAYGFRKVDANGF